MLILNEKHFLTHWRVYYSLHFTIESFMNFHSLGQCVKKRKPRCIHNNVCVFILMITKKNTRDLCLKERGEPVRFFIHTFSTLFPLLMFLFTIQINFKLWNELSSFLLHSNIIYSSNKINFIHPLHVTCIHSTPCHHPRKVTTRILVKKQKNWKRRKLG